MELAGNICVCFFAVSAGIALLMVAIVIFKEAFKRDRS
jgi:hypothetical protein